jgi:hypothetical protein
MLVCGPNERQEQLGKMIAIINGTSATKSKFHGLDVVLQQSVSQRVDVTVTFQHVQSVRRCLVVFSFQLRTRLSKPTSTKYGAMMNKIYWAFRVVLEVSGLRFLQPQIAVPGYEDESTSETDCFLRAADSMLNLQSMEDQKPTDWRTWCQRHQALIR